jgi:hypothetical protein
VGGNFPSPALVKWTGAFVVVAGSKFSEDRSFVDLWYPKREIKLAVWVLRGPCVGQEVEWMRRKIVLFCPAKTFVVKRSGVGGKRERV